MASEIISTAVEEAGTEATQKRYQQALERHQENRGQGFAILKTEVMSFQVPASWLWTTWTLTYSLSAERQANVSCGWHGVSGKLGTRFLSAETGPEDKC